MRSLCHIILLVLLALGCSAQKSAQNVESNLPTLPNPNVSVALETLSPSAEPDAGKGDIGFCSGVAISKNLFATAAHCADGSATVWTRTLYKRGAAGYDVHWSYRDVLADIAVGQVSGAPFDAYAPLRCTLPLKGEFLQLVHHGKRDYWRYDAGQFLGVESAIGEPPDSIEGTLLIAALRALPGSSGSGVLDAEGRLVGVVSAVFNARPELIIISSVRNVPAFCEPN